ncbi:hypothetical protein GmHk_18G051660 [Glycine max]|nr:hypothetical protein GmHk_18G051660 [Glycine max]
MVKLMCGSHNYELVKSLVGHPYIGQLTKDKKIIIADMTKLMVKSRNILLTLKEHNANSYTTIKQVYNATNAYRSSIRDNNTEIQQLVKLLEQDKYIHWHRLKDEDVVRDIFWSYLDAVKQCNACNLIIPIKQTCTDFYYLTLLVSHQRDALPGVIVTDKDLTLINVVKTVFPECTNLSCQFQIDKNMKTNCKSLFDGCLMKFEIAYSPWPMFVDYVNQTWIIPHKERFVKAWMNKVMHLGNTITNRVEYAYWALKRLLHNSFGDLYSVREAMNNMITPQQIEIKASFETSTHVVGHVFKVTLYKKLLGMIDVEYEHVSYVGIDSSRCGCVMRNTHGIPCVCELVRYIVGSIPLGVIHMFWQRLSFSAQGLSESEVSIIEEMKTISKRFEELDVCGKVTLKSKLREIAYPNLNPMCPPP